ncbi:GNAT family N-acetyltransferase [Pararoseomonas indoligenes]|uniref:GNAT family N-acetyltransferase n=1 Tax=Roseomonas indoligenes TaxID=2820811 RepID=A0A940S8W9_9PROT|nr:GNAT family N-acetyltransferase [Pararoseomonas indoligenes]MBP0494532.1 GNAT family N-acetyltransferase [Pararoseomonas indoligenes]
MAPTEALPVAALGTSAMDGCLALSREAGWNQAEADWRLFFEDGTVFGIGGERPVATGAVLPYREGGFAWIGMVLVTASQRGRGLGTRVLRHGLGLLAEAGLVPVLDATPAGARIYRPLGFVAQLGLTRWRGPGGGEAPEGPRRVTAEDLPRLAALDAGAFGAARPSLLGALMRRAPAVGHLEGEGFVLGRDGDRATQLGPLVAPDEAAALRLLRAALARAPGEVIIDIADRCTALADALRARGFAPERPYTRMALGHAAPFGDPSRLMAVAGPELG